MTLNEQKEELKSFLLSKQNTGQCNLYWFKKHYIELYNVFLTWNFPSSFSITQKFYHYLNDDKELKLGICPVCGNRCNFKTFKKGYTEYCCVRCTNIYRRTEKFKQKQRQTCLERHGGQGNASKDILKKYRETCLERYGVDCNAKLESNKAKVKQTCLEKYGVDSFSKTDEFKEKSKQTCIERYGVDSYSKTDECKEKIKEAIKERYGDENYNNREQAKETCLERFGKAYYTQTEEMKEKSNKTKLERYGDEKYNNPEKNKQTCIERYGVDNPFKNKEIREKAKETCIERYGKESYAQTEDYLKKSHETKTKNHSFSSSSIEEEFAKWLTENNYKFERQYRSEPYPFNCDFYLSEYNLYIEIQGSWVHGHHPFDENIEEDKMTLDKWNQKKECHPYYLNAINVWTKSDVEKRNIAKENNLNYLEIFSCKLDECVKTFKKYVNV